MKIYVIDISGDGVEIPFLVHINNIKKMRRNGFYWDIWLYDNEDDKTLLTVADESGYITSQLKNLLSNKSKNEENNK